MSTKVEYELSLKDLFSGKINSANAAVNKFEGSLGNVRNSLGSFGAAVGVAFGAAAIVAFGRKMIDAGSMVENSLTGLTTLLKDKAEAQQVINKTMEDATKTPFAFEGLLNANKALIGAGVESKRAREDVLNLANAIAATGGGDNELQRMVVNMQQIKNVGKATALDIKQFAFANINIYQVLADAMGKTTDKVKDMDVSYDMLTMALKKAHDQGGLYAGGLENMAGNTSVRISNLGDSIFQLSVKMYNDLKPAIDFMISGLGKFIDAMSSTWNWMVKNKELLLGVSVALGIAGSALALYTTYVNAAAFATKMMTALQWALNAAMLNNPIGLLIAGFAALIGYVVYCYNEFVIFRGVLWGVGEFIREFVSMSIEQFKNLGTIIHGVLTFNPAEIMEGASKAVDMYQSVGERLGGAFNKGFDQGVADFRKNALNTNKYTASPATLGGKKNAVKGLATDSKSETSKATGNKSISINIKIDNLIKDFQIKTTNITEGVAKTKEMVAQALLSAVNDSQIVAGQ